MRFLFLLLWCTTLAAKPEYELSIAAMFKNEAPYLREWIEFHRIVGVEHFFLCNNNSTDEYREVLQPYIDEGVVDLFESPLPCENQTTYIRAQGAIYNDILKQVGRTSLWIAFLDIDEFLFPVEEQTLTECLNTRFRFCAGVVVNWQMFGSSNVEKIPDGTTTIETFTRKAPANCDKNLYVKSIVKPRCTQRFVAQPHFPIMDPIPYFVREDGSRFSGKLNRICTNILRINHYWTRDLDYIRNIKAPRYAIWQEKPLDVVVKELVELSGGLHSSVNDTTILKYLPELRRRLGYSL